MPAPKLLVVTVDRQLAEQLFLAGRAAGTSVKLAYDGVAAARWIADWRPDAVVVDDRIAGVGGWSLAELLMLEAADGPFRLVVLVEAEAEATRQDGVEIIARDVPVEMIVAQLAALLATSDGASRIMPPTPPAGNTEPLRLGDVMPIAKRNLGGIPSLAVKPQVGYGTRSGQLKSVPREQSGTQQPREARPNCPPAPIAGRRSRPSGRMSVGEHYLLDAAFADLAATWPPH